MGFYITTFLLGGLVAGNASHARADQTKPSDKASVNADNTKQNAEDRKADKATADDQANDSASVELSARIRRSVIDAKNLSTNARNVKIISSKRMVTLRGPVNSEVERQRVFHLATEVAGAGNVTNELEIIKK